MHSFKDPWFRAGEPEPRTAHGAAEVPAGQPQRADARQNHSALPVDLEALLPPSQASVTWGAFAEPACVNRLQRGGDFPQVRHAVCMHTHVSRMFRLDLGLL